MTGPEQICITNGVLKSCLPFFPGTLCFCIRHFAVHLSYKQVLMANFFTLNGVQKETPHFHHLLFSSSRSWRGLSLAAISCSLLCLHTACTTPVKRQSRKERWWSKSKLSLKHVNKSCMNEEQKLLFCLKPGTEEGLNSHPLLSLLFREPELSTYQ